MSIDLQDAVTLAQDLRVDAELTAFRPDSGDMELEAAIEIEMTICLHDERYTRDQRVAAFEEVRRLHRQRRPQMVEWLEKQRGLR